MATSTSTRKYGKGKKPMDWLLLTHIVIRLNLAQAPRGQGNHLM